MPKYLNNSLNQKTPLEQNVRINTSNSTLQVTMALMPDSVVYQKIQKPASLSDQWYQHVAHPLKIGQIPNHNSSMKLWHHFFHFSKIAKD